MINLIYFSNSGLELYYQSLLEAFVKDKDIDLCVYGPGYPHYNPTDNLAEVASKSGFNNVDLYFFSAGWDLDTSLESVDPHPNINASKTDIPKFYLLNKEYKKLNLRLEYAKLNNFDTCFTVHHDYKKWQEETGINFVRLPFAADEQVFKDYNEQKTHDLGFSGNLHNYKNDGTELGKFKVSMMGNNFQNIRERSFQKLFNSEKTKSLKFFHSNQYFYNEQYSRLINSSKCWYCTPSAIDIVGTRFFEIMGSKTLLFCSESDAYEGLFNQARHCATFKPDLSDIEEKLLYYLNNDKERSLIVDRAQEHFLKNHTWKNRINKIKETFKSL